MHGKSTLSTTRIHLPWWLVIIIVLQILPMFAGPYVALTNPQFLGGQGAEELNQAAFTYTARNVAVGFALITALALRNGPMLFILIFIRLVTDLIDLPTFFAFNNSMNMVRVTAIFVFLYYIPSVIALRYLWKQMKTSDVKPSGQPAAWTD